MGGCFGSVFQRQGKGAGPLISPSVSRAALQGAIGNKPDRTKSIATKKPACNHSSASIDGDHDQKGVLCINKCLLSIEEKGQTRRGANKEKGAGNSAAQELLLFERILYACGCLATAGAGGAIAGIPRGRGGGVKRDSASFSRRLISHFLKVACFRVPILVCPSISASRHSGGFKTGEMAVATVGMC